MNEASADSVTSSAATWTLRKRVLPQDTDYSGIMWHGAYVGWLEEARVETLSAVGIDYDKLSEEGISIPVVCLKLDYHQALRHGDVVTLKSRLLPAVGVRLPWSCRIVDDENRCLAEAQVDMVVVRRSGCQMQVLRRPPEPLASCIARVRCGPAEG